MNKTVISLALIVTSAIFLAGCTKQTTPTTQTPGQTVSEAKQFADAIASGKPTTCVMTKNTEKTEYFIKSKKMFANMTTIIENKTILSHMINDEKYLYMWTDGTKQGSKINLQVSPLPASSPTESTGAPKFESETDYQNIKNEGYIINCKDSNIDDTAFIPPSDVKFVDPTEIMRQLASPAENGQIDPKQLEELKKQFGAE